MNLPLPHEIEHTNRDRHSLTPIISLLLLVGLAFSAGTPAAISKADYKDLTATKAGDYSYTVKDKLGATLSTDTVKNTIDKPTNTLKDCNMFDCELKIQITPSKELSLEKEFIKGLANKPGVTFDKPFFNDIKQVKMIRPTYKDVLEESCTPQIDNKTGKNTTACKNTTVQKETGTETYLAPEAFENTDLSVLGKETTVILRAHKTDMNLVVDLGYSIYGQERWDAAWWNVTYTSRFPINCSLVTAGTPIVINGSSGFSHNGTTQIVWTTCQANLYLYYNTALGQYAVANDTAQVPMEVELGNASNYGDVAAMWRTTGAVGVWHMGTNTSLADSANYNNLTATGTNTLKTANMGYAINFSGGSYYTKSSPAGLPIGTNGRTIQGFIKFGSVKTIREKLLGWGADSNYQAYNLDLSIDATTGSLSIFTYIGQALSGLTLQRGNIMVAALSNSATSQRFAINTTFADGANANAINTGSTTLRIGAGTWDASEDLMDTEVTELRIFNTSKSDLFLNQTYYNSLGTAGYGTLEAEESRPAGAGELTVNYTTGGIATGSNNTFTPPANLTINATTYVGNYFAGWTTNCTGSISDPATPNTQIEILDELPCYAQASFLPNGGNLTVTAGTGGTATGSNDTFDAPVDLPIDASPIGEYYFWNWTTNCTGTIDNITSANTFISMAFNESCEITANFKICTDASLSFSPLMTPDHMIVTVNTTGVMGSYMDIIQFNQTDCISTTTSTVRLADGYVTGNISTTLSGLLYFNHTDLPLPMGVDRAFIFNAHTWLNNGTELDTGNRTIYLLRSTTVEAENMMGEFLILAGVALIYIAFKGGEKHGTN